jgi:hypothetical protein
VLFKPTLASKRQFRPDFDSALSYFVATNNVCPEDGGFAIKGWTSCRWENSNIILSGSRALAMGNYYFTLDGSDVKVEYTFGYFLDSEGNVKINLHHSSMPYDPKPTITREQVVAAQRAWGDGIVRLSDAKRKGEDYEKMGRDHIDRFYGFREGPVLFKPTLAAERQFRPDFDSALSYFVATNGACPEDGGFAIKGWTSCRWENSDVILSGSTALAMGNYYFTLDGAETKVEYTFGYFLDAEGSVKINLHHSSLPYQPAQAPAEVDKVETVDRIVAAIKYEIDEVGVEPLKEFFAYMSQYFPDTFEMLRKKMAVKQLSESMGKDFVSSRL